jgi:hypothetical protein
MKGTQLACATIASLEVRQITQIARSAPRRSIPPRIMYSIRHRKMTASGLEVEKVEEWERRRSDMVSPKQTKMGAR